MNYLKFGTSKNVLVFLHGWGADKNSFLWVKDYFDDYTLIFVDFPGFGESDLPDFPYHVSDYVLELRAILNKIEIENLILVGHSFGGRVAIKYAFSFQDDYDKFGLVLVDAAGIKPRRGIKYYFKVMRYKNCKKKAIKSQKYANKLKKYGSADFNATSGVMRQTFINVVNENLAICAKCIRCKTFLIWGENDKDTKLYMAKKLFRYIDNSELYVIKNAGHFSFLDKPKEFLIILDTFIKKF